MFRSTSSARPRAKLARAFATAVTTLALGGLLAAGMAVPATAATSTATAKKAAAPSLTLKVMAGKAIVPGARVTLYESYYGGEFVDQVATKKADATGKVTFTRLYKGSRYAAEITAPVTNPAFSTYATGWFGQTLGKTGAAAASSYQADAGSYRMGAGNVSKTVSLKVGGVLDGVLYGADGKPFTDAFSVVAYRQVSRVNEDPDYSTSESNDFIHEATVFVQPSATGAYTLPGLRDGQYVIEFDQSARENWASKVFNNKATTKYTAELEGGWSFDGVTGSLDGHLVEAGKIAGTVSYAPALKANADHGTVEAYTFRKSQWIDEVATGDLYASVPVAADGTYAFSGLTPNDYALKFVPGVTSSKKPYFSEWYNDASTRQGATLVPVTAGATAAADARLAQGFALSGVVTDHSGKPVKGVEVSLDPEYYDEDSYAGDDDYEYATTDAKGAYSFTDVRPSIYTLSFWSTSGARYYAAATPGGVRDSAKADELTFTEGAQVADLQYAEASTLTVHVATRKGVDVIDADVTATSVVDGHSANTSYFDEGTYASPVRGKPGFYKFDDLQPGVDYALAFDVSWSERQDVYSQYLGGATNIADADLVTAKAGSRTLDITLAPSGSLSGKISMSSGKIPSNTYALLYHYSGSGWEQWSASNVSSSGAYSFANLDSGSYTVAFGTDNVLGNGGGVFAGGSSTAASATAFYIAPGKPVVYNTKLPAPGKITGAVTDEAGKKLAGIEVVALRLDGTPGNWAGYSLAGEEITNSKGTFAIGDLTPGAYTLAYVKDIGGGTSLVYVGDPSDPDLDVFTVTAGATIASGTKVLSSDDTVGDEEDPNATALISGSLDPKIPNAEGFIFLDSDTNGYMFDLKADGTFSGAVVPGTYDYTAWVSSKTNDVYYAESTGTIEVVAGKNTLSVPVSPWAATKFGQQPTLNTTATTVGTAYSVSATWSNVSDTYADYQWLRDGKPIKWATDKTYTSRGADLGSVLSVRVTLQDGWTGGAPVSAIATVGVVTESSALSNAVLPTITGSGPAVAGTTLKANPGEWSVPGATFTYEWFRNDTILVGTDATYTLAPEDADQGISVVVHASKVGYEDAAATSRTVVVAPTSTLVVVTQPTLNGANPTPVNSVLRVSPGEWSVPAKYTYSWLRDGKLIPGATGSAYQATDRDFGYEISAQVTATAVGFTSATVETNGYVISVAPAAVASKRPTISGKAAVGVTLTVKPGVWNHSTLSFSYVWKSNGVVIDGATADTFTPTVAQKGTRIAVEVTAKRHGYLDGTAVTKSTYTVK